MAAIGGSILEITLFGRIFAVAADAEAQRKLGGWENEVQANGDGGARIVKTRVPLSITGLTVEVDDSRGDDEFLQELADEKDFFEISITYASGITYQGSAIITDTKETSSQNATCSISLSGPGKLTRQS